jgi:TDG/mug DNA glycosylase family protein
MTLAGAMPEPLPDILAKGLDVVFCGINPALSAAAAGHHFVARTNRFWRVIHLAGFTPEEVHPENDRTLLQHGCGLTAVVERPTARADELTARDFAAVATRFERKIARFAPRFVAFLGKAAYSALSGEREITWGSQAAPFGGAEVWVLPNPSGRNRAFSLEQLIERYRAFHQAVVFTASAPPTERGKVRARTRR